MKSIQDRSNEMRESNRRRLIRGMKFKVGDKVRVRKETNDKGVTRDDLCIVTERKAMDDASSPLGMYACYFVEIKSKGPFAFRESEIEKA